MRSRQPSPLNLLIGSPGEKTFCKENVKGKSRGGSVTFEKNEKEKQKENNNKTAKKTSKTLAKGVMYREQWVRKFGLSMHPRNFGDRTPVCPHHRLTHNKPM